MVSFQVNGNCSFIICVWFDSSCVVSLGGLC